DLFAKDPDHYAPQYDGYCAMGASADDAAHKDTVGKDDLQAQIEQVGKNVGTCLEAGGATLKDIALTISYVKQPAEFERYADLRLSYFGPPSPQSTIAPMPQSTGPDFLVQVEAIAKTQ